MTTVEDIERLQKSHPVEANAEAQIKFLAQQIDDLITLLGEVPVSDGPGIAVVDELEVPGNDDPDADEDTDADDEVDSEDDEDDEDTDAGSPPNT